MVCKEDVFSWFQNLKANKRIEAMCGILNMCYPIELRFYGTCIEDLGRKDFYVYKDDETKANDINEIVKIRNIHETGMRSRLIIMLSLLNSSNTNCAKEIFKVLSDEIKIENLAASGLLMDSRVVDQYLVLLTIAQHHPAFTFEQQTFLTHLSINLESCIRELSLRTKCEFTESYLPSYFPGVVLQQNVSERDMPVTGHLYRCSTSQQSKLYESPFETQITSLKAKAPHKRMSIRIRVAWGCNKVADAFKTPHDLFVFHKELVRMFPSEAKSINQDKCIPPMPVAIATWNKQHNLNESIISIMAEYIQQLNSRLPGYIFENEFVRKFFMPSNSNRASIARSVKHSDHKLSELPPRSSRLRSFTIYNSQISENSSGGPPENRQKLQSSCLKKYPENSSMYPQASPAHSPLQSPLSSPYVSPGNSTTNSRAPSPWSSTGVNEPSVDKPQIKDTLEQWESIKNYRSEELQTVPIEEFDALRIQKDSGVKVAKTIDKKSPPNGIVSCYVPKGILPAKSISLNQSNSNDSSPICSEYSSPPQSPSPCETCNQSSSLSSSNDENIDKRSLSNALTDLCKVEDSESNTPDTALKPADDDSLNIKSNISRTLSVIPLAIPYSTIVTQLPPLQNIKPAYLPIPCRTNSAPQHLSPGTVVFDNQFSRVPLASALTFIPGSTRSHPDRVMSSVSLPISTISPFPVVTSGCATAPSASCSVSTYKSSNMTMVTNSTVSGNRHTQKNNNPVRDCDISPKPMLQTTETPYVTGYILNSSSPLTAASCPCFTTNTARPSPAPSPSILSPGAAPQPSAVPVSMSYLGMPYLFHHSIPYLQTQTPANGFVPQPGLTNHGQSFSYTLPNGITTIPPELIYPEQTYTVQSPSTQGNPSQIASPGSQCYGVYTQSGVSQKLITCYNCGKIGHRGPDCKEPTMDDVNKSGKFQLNYNPVKAPDSHE